MGSDVARAVNVLLIARKDSVFWLVSFPEELALIVVKTAQNAFLVIVELGRADFVAGLVTANALGGFASCRDGGCVRGNQKGEGKNGCRNKGCVAHRNLAGRKGRRLNNIKGLLKKELLLPVREEKEAKDSALTRKVRPSFEGRGIVRNIESNEIR